MLSFPSGVAIPVPGNLIGNSSSSAIIGAEILPRMEDPVFVRAGPSVFHFPAPRNLLIMLTAALARSYPAKGHRQIAEEIEQEGHTRARRSLSILADTRAESQRQLSYMQVISWPYV